MADDKTTDKPPVGESQDKPQAGSATEPQGGEEKFDAEYVRALRKEAAQYRTRLKALEDAQRAADDAKLSDQEKLQKRLAELERAAAEASSNLQKRVVEYEVKLAASRLGIVDPDAAWRLIDASSLEFDESGKPKNLDRVLSDLLKAKPYLSAQPTARNGAAGSGTQGSPTTFSMNDAIRRAAGRQ